MLLDEIRSCLQLDALLAKPCSNNCMLLAKTSLDPMVGSYYFIFQPDNDAIPLGFLQSNVCSQSHRESFKLG